MGRRAGCVGGACRRSGGRAAHGWLIVGGAAAAVWRAGEGTWCAPEGEGGPHGEEPPIGRRAGRAGAVRARRARGACRRSVGRAAHGWLLVVCAAAAVGRAGEGPGRALGGEGGPRGEEFGRAEGVAVGAHESVTSAATTGEVTRREVGVRGFPPRRRPRKAKRAGQEQRRRRPAPPPRLARAPAGSEAQRAARAARARPARPFTPR